MSNPYIEKLSIEEAYYEMLYKENLLETNIRKQIQEKKDNPNVKTYIYGAKDLPPEKEGKVG